MTKYEGATVDEALEKGLGDLKLSKNDVTIKVLSMGKKGILGNNQPAVLEIKPKVKSRTLESSMLEGTKVSLHSKMPKLYEAPTAEEALTLGLQDLNMSKKQVKIKILDLGKSDGVGKGQPAKVMLTPKEEFIRDRKVSLDTNVSVDSDMLESNIFESSTPEEALSIGLKSLGLAKSDVKIKVLDLGNPSGLGKNKLAKVKLTPKRSLHENNINKQKKISELANIDSGESTLKEIKQSTTLSERKSIDTERVVKVFEGETVESALEKGLKELNLRKEDVTVKVLNSAKKGIFGVGSKLARIVIKTKDIDYKLDSIAEKQPKEEDLVVVEEQPKEEDLPVVEEQPKEEGLAVVEEQPKEEGLAVVEEQPKEADLAVVEEQPKEEALVVVEEQPRVDAAPLRNLSKNRAIDALKGYLESITKEMGYPATVEVIEGEHHVTFDLDCEKQGVLIGKHGKVLNSLQYMAEMFVNRISGKKIPVMINVGEYRRRREITLNKLAVETAKKVNETNESISLDPMLSFERQQVRNTLLADDSVTLRSEGHEPFRFVIVEPKEKN